MGMAMAWGEDTLLRQGRQLRKVRVRAGLTLRELAGRIGLSHTSLLQYEHGRAQPSGRTLLALAREMGVTPEDLGRPTHEALRVPVWPAAASLSGRLMARLATRILDGVDRAEGVRNLGTLQEELGHLDAGLMGPLRSAEEAEQRADRLRVLWGQGLHPWRNLAAELERRGWVVVHAPLSMVAPLARRPVHVGPWLVAVLPTEPDLALDQEGAAEVLGWFLVGDAGQDPRWVRRFARALLVPRLVAEREPGRGVTRMDLRELLLLKAGHGLSMGGWLDRFRDLDLLPVDACAGLAEAMHARGWMEREPVREGSPPSAFEGPILRALNEGRIDIAHAAVLLGESQLAFASRSRGEAPRGRPRLH
ncbi:MAG: helix-turn-helix transcriptional regulator [Candidatus Sericytochromatia bacterium]|nr:helix-turn-helix transcriptional regulator [Candidatus Tanganyikabacteria bacterium]